MDEDAIDSMRGLLGFSFVGNPLRINFAKAASVAHLIQLVTFPADYIYMYVPQMFSSIQFNSTHLIKATLLAFTQHKSAKLAIK